jgi:eukaryotic-like serine/threonine-protein kinase
MSATRRTQYAIEIEPVALNLTGEIQKLGPQTVTGYLEQITADVWLSLVMISGGAYLMGSPYGTGESSERPQHHVAIQPFWLGQFLITQAQWMAMMGQSPSRFAGMNLPVDNVSWEEANRFCQRLAKKTSRNYRLPSEAEWEYACRAGTSTAFHTGETISTEVANYNGEFIYCSGPRGVYRHTTTEGGSFPPNAFGVYDMHGNLWEWCADGWHENYVNAPSNGQAWQPGHNERGRVLRGGCWHDIPDVCRSAARMRYEANEGDEFVGFRVAVSV